MVYSFHLETLDSLELIYQQHRDRLNWTHIFVLPGWLKAWWRVFADGYEPLICMVFQDSELIGVAPFKKHGTSVTFIGDASVCDYADFIVEPGKESAFIDVLLDNLISIGIKDLHLETLRPDSLALKILPASTPRKNTLISSNIIDVSFEMILPADWDSYMTSLEARQRHDVERKLRKLSLTGEVGFSVLKDHEITAEELGIFLEMMTQSRRDKSVFLTPEMRAYFKELTQSMSDYGILRLGFLKLGMVKVAAVLYFDYNNRIYLYNSGYNPDYAELSVGLISKLLCIREAIINKKRVFDFLKGAETYKPRLGGHEIALSACHLGLS